MTQKLPRSRLPLESPFFFSHALSSTLLRIIFESLSYRLQEVGLRYCKAELYKPHINQFKMKRRLAFTKKYVNMPVSFWREIIWSDESK